MRVLRQSGAVRAAPVLLLVLAVLFAAQAPAAGASTLAWRGASAVEDQTYTVGNSIPVLRLPRAASDTGPLTFTLSPAPPAGLMFDATPSRGRLTGTPGRAQSATTYTYRVEDAAGDSLERRFTIEVQGEVPVATLAAGTSPVTEGTGAGFTVRLSSPAPEGGVTVGVTVADAGDGSDFVAPGNEGAKTVTVPAGQNSATYSVATVGDDEYEPNGEVTVTLAAGTGYTVGSPSSATVTVHDDDEPRLFASAIDLTPHFGSRRVSNQSYTEYTRIGTLTLPRAFSGNRPLRYTLSGDLPAGLDFDEATRQLTGTPTEAQNATTYTWTATDADGDKSSLTFTITVAAVSWDVSVSGTDDAMFVRWPAFPTANRYRVQWRIGGESYSTTERSHTAGAGDTGHRLRDLTLSEKYFVRVTALRVENDTENVLKVSGEIEHVTHGHFDAYADPAVGEARALDVEWEAVEGGAAGYVIEWGPSTDDCKGVADERSLANRGSVTGDKLTYRVTGLLPDTEYDVRVTPYTTHGSASAPDGLSWTECGKPTHTEITNVTVSPVDGSSTELTVSWTKGTSANAYPIEKYVVRWKSGTGDYPEANRKTVADGTSTSTTIDNLTADTEYTVRVIAQVPTVPGHSQLLDGDTAEGTGTTGGVVGAGGAPEPAPGEPTITVYHDPSGPASAVSRYDTAVGLLDAASRRYEVRTVTGTGKVDRLAGVSNSVMPRFFLGDPEVTGWGPAQAKVNNGGLRWLRSKLAELQPPAPTAGVSVADARVREAPGATLDFAVTLDRAVASAVTVDYATSDGTATAGTDYTATSGTLTFAAGETAKTVTVPVLDDAHDEGEETLTLTLSNAAGAQVSDAEATGTIENTDPMPRAWLARAGRTIGSQVVEALGSRLEGGGDTDVTVAGVRLDTGGVHEMGPGAAPRWRHDGSAWEPRSMTAQELLAGTAFHLSSGGGEAGGPGFAAWGRFARDRFEGEADGTPMDGDVTTGFLGADAEWDRLLAGLMVSHSRSEGAYRGSDGAGTIESTLTGVYPYARLALSERISAWSLAGMGEGELTLEPDGQDRMETDVSLRMGAVGVVGRLLDGAGGLALDLRSDAMWVGTESDAVETAQWRLAATESDVTRLRLVLDGSRAFALGNGAMFTPNAQAGVRVDGGDAETGAGVELGAGVGYTAGRLVIEGAVRALVAHEASGYEEWGASGAVRLQPGASGRGLSLTLNPTWGNAANDAERLWQARDASELGLAEDFEAEARLEAEFGYGFSVGGMPGVMTPYAGFTAAGSESRAVRTGARWRIAPDATLNLEAARSEGANDDTPPEHRIGLEATFRW